jgi:hypothetical protein
VAIIKDFQQIATRKVRKGGQSPVIEHQQIGT